MNSEADPAIWQHPFKPMLNNWILPEHLTSPRMIHFHRFKWRKSSVAKLLDPPIILPLASVCFWAYMLSLTRKDIDIRRIFPQCLHPPLPPVVWVTMRCGHAQRISLPQIELFILRTTKELPLPNRRLQSTFQSANERTSKFTVEYSQIENRCRESKIMDLSEILRLGPELSGPKRTADEFQLSRVFKHSWLSSTVY